MAGRKPDDPTAFSVEMRGRIAKTPFGWFMVKGLEVTDRSLALTINANKLAPPSRNDLEIIKQTKSLLSNDSKWNRNATGNCTSNTRKLDLYCALRIATINVTGTFHYRQPAIQAARGAAGELAGASAGAHRLRAYNNAKTTTLSDIQLALDFARDEIKDSIPS